MKAIFLNDEPYRSTQENPLKALGDTVSFSVDDWAATRAMAWVWGIVCGWSDDALDELAVRHGWSDGAKARLRSLHERFAELESDLLAAVRAGVESGTIEGEVVRWCVKHHSAMFTNRGETCHMSQISAYRQRNPFDRITCEVVERLLLGPLSDGEEDRP